MELENLRRTKESMHPVRMEEEIYDPGAGEKLKFVKKYTDKFRKSIHMTHKTLYLMELIALYEEI